jgi:hypothetical protein
MTFAENRGVKSEECKCEGLHKKRITGVWNSGNPNLRKNRREVGT